MKQSNLNAINTMHAFKTTKVTSKANLLKMEQSYLIHQILAKSPLTQNLQSFPYKKAWKKSFPLPWRLLHEENPKGDCSPSLARQKQKSCKVAFLHFATFCINPQIHDGWALLHSLKQNNILLPHMIKNQLRLAFDWRWPSLTILANKPYYNQIWNKWLPHLMQPTNNQEITQYLQMTN